MQHYFDVEIATKYGLYEAIILNNLWYWIKKNEANEKHFHDGKYWTYNSIKAFKKLFPYLSERQINYTLTNLINNKIIISGNYNQSSYDRTKWYAFTKMGVSIMQKCKMEYAKMSNGFYKSAEPIPNNKPDNKPNTTTTNIYNYYEVQYGRTLAPIEYQEMTKWLDMFDEDVIKHAIDISVLSGGNSINYITKIINSWYDKHYRNLEEILIAERKFKNKKEVDDDPYKYVERC